MRASDRRRKQSASLAFVNPDLIAEEAVLEEPQRREDGQGSYDVLAPSSGSVVGGTQLLAMGVDEYVVCRLLFLIFC
jgi:hypothetical protein